MKAIYSDRPPCKLERGHIRRVPQNPRSFVVGYHVCCPKCGFVTIALQGKNGLEVTEKLGEFEVSFSTPLRCTYCNILIHLDRSRIELQEDKHVRAVRYR
jgi:hypothetical protein